PELAYTPGWSAFPFIGPTYPYCKVDTNFLTQVKLLGTSPIPRVDVLFGATFQSLPGPQIGALYVANNAATFPSLGRPLSGGVTKAPENIPEAGKTFSPEA